MRRLYPLNRWLRRLTSLLHPNWNPGEQWTYCHLINLDEKKKKLKRIHSLNIHDISECKLAYNQSIKIKMNQSKFAYSLVIFIWKKKPITEQKLVVEHLITWKVYARFGSRRRYLGDRCFRFSDAFAFVHCTPVRRVQIVAPIRRHHPVKKCWSTCSVEVWSH